ncbi:MAG TPA: ribonuclease R [Acholeplasmataceae bacterium]|nr:ribonuclease R [Acholeplasmataceae bacterium]
MKEKLLEIINNPKYQPLTVSELTALLNLGKNGQILIDELAKDKEVFYSKSKERLLNHQQAGIFKGKLSVAKDGYGFIKSEGFEIDFFVPKTKLNGALDKDIVLFTIHDYLNKSKNEKQEAHIIEVIERHLKYIIGEVVQKNKELLLASDETVLPLHFNKLEKVKEGQVVRCKIINYNNDYLEGEVVEVIGNSTDIGMDITIIARKYGFEAEFPQEVIDEVNNLSEDLTNEIKRREFIDRTIITIDGADAKDLDDAVSIRKLKNGNYELGVYIADVSYYVPKDSEIDKEALKRGTSVYLIDRVIPMLPKRISNNICSLNENENKLVIACIMEINNKGKIIDTVLKEAVIKTKHRMTYDSINEIIEGNEKAINKYNNIYNDVLLMQELSEILEKMRGIRGSVDFDIPESEVIVDEKGKPIEIRKRERKESEKFIESFMICANEATATMITNMKLPFIYRVHDEPSEDRLNTFVTVIKLFGYPIKQKIRKITPSQVQDLIGIIKEEDKFLNSLLLRMMSKAIYSRNNIGHFGLSSLIYTHFTSPIRRYPDLLVHRLIRKYLFTTDFSNLNSLEEYIDDVASQSSKQERAAMNCEYDVIDMKKAEYMEGFIGVKYSGVITSVTSFGMFIEVLGAIEGLVKLSEMRGYKYDDQKMSIVSVNGKGSYKIGDKLQVKVVSAIKKKGEINFEIVYNKNTKSARTTNKKRNYGGSRNERRKENHRYK